MTPGRTTERRPGRTLKIHECTSWRTLTDSARGGYRARLCMKGGDLCISFQEQRRSPEVSSASMEWAVKVTEYIKSTHDIDVSLWSLAQGAPVGTVGWSARFESHAAQAEATAGIQGDQQYLKHVGRRPGLHHPGLRARLVQADPQEGTGERSSSGGCADHRAGRERHDRRCDCSSGSKPTSTSASLTGYPSAFLADAYGPFGQVTWIQGLPDMAAVDARTRR